MLKKLPEVSRFLYQKLDGSKLLLNQLLGDDGIQFLWPLLSCDICGEEHAILLLQKNVGLCRVGLALQSGWCHYMGTGEELKKTLANSPLLAHPRLSPIHQ